MNDLSTPILDKAQFHQELWLEIAMASDPYFPPMEVLDPDNALLEFQHKIIGQVIDRNADLFRRLADCDGKAIR